MLETPKLRKPLYISYRMVTDAFWRSVLACTVQAYACCINRLQLLQLVCSGPCADRRHGGGMTYDIIKSLSLQCMVTHRQISTAAGARCVSDRNLFNVRIVLKASGGVPYSQPYPGCMGLACEQSFGIALQMQDFWMSLIVAIVIEARVATFCRLPPKHYTYNSFPGP